MGITPQIQVATFGMGDSLLIMVIALVVLGPRRLPQVGRQIGKLMYEFRKASNDFKFQMEEELRNAEEADRRKREEAERQRTLAETQSAVAQAQSAAEQALNAAEKAQSAAQKAQSAADGSQVPEVKPEGPAGAAGFDEHDAAAEPDMIYTFGGGAEKSEEGDMAAGVEPTTAEAEPAAEQGLRVQPPSTGEQVPAARPGRAGMTPAAEIAAEAGAATTAAPAGEAVAVPSAAEQEISIRKEVAAEATSEATESTAHHG